jgi:hypothetical protein
MQHGRGDRHINHAIDDPLDDDVDRYLNRQVTRDESNLNARESVLHDRVQRTEERCKQRQEDEQAQASD